MKGGEDSGGAKRRRGLIPDAPGARTGASGHKAGKKRDGHGARPSKPEDAFAPAMGITGAVIDIIDIIRSYSAASDGRDRWDLIVRTVAENDSLPHSQVEVIERAIAEAYRGWSDAQRRSIWYETDSGMTDDDDDEICDTSFNGIGYALQVEMLDEVTQAAWRDAEELKKVAAKGTVPTRGRAK